MKLPLKGWQARAAAAAAAREKLRCGAASRSLQRAAKTLAPGARLGRKRAANDLPNSLAPAGTAAAAAGWGDAAQAASTSFRP